MMIGGTPTASSIATITMTAIAFVVSFPALVITPPLHFSVQPLCSLCLCGVCDRYKPQRHREHRGCTEKKRKLLFYFLPMRAMIAAPASSVESCPPRSLVVSFAEI